MTPKQRKDQKLLQEKLLADQKNKPKAYAKPPVQSVADQIIQRKEAEKRAQSAPPPKPVQVVSRINPNRKRSTGEPGFSSFGMKQLLTQ